jgi:hypothetical protein
MIARKNILSPLISVILMCSALIIVGTAKTEEAPGSKTKIVSENGREFLHSKSPRAGNDVGERDRQIPFDLLWSKIILPVRVNDSRELSIILDTGMPSPGLLLFDKDFSDELQLSGTEKFRIHGAGTGQVSYALKVESAKLSLSGVDFENQEVRILQNDSMRGSPTDGVIGSTLFGSHVVKIDYDKKIITLLEPSMFVADPTWETVNLTFNENSIPFLEASVSMAGDKEIDVSLYIDLASSEALELLVKPEMKFKLPDNLPSKYIGKGLDGHIVGQYGRVSRLKIGSFVLHDVSTAFPKSEVRSRQQEADGILCNDALRRFNLIFDYGREKLYIKPNSHFSEPFNHN